MPYARHVFIQDREAPFEFRKMHSFFSFFNNKAHTHTHRESTEKTKVCYDKQEQTVLFNKVDRRKGNPKNTKRLLKPQNTLSFFFLHFEEGLLAQFSSVLISKASFTNLVVSSLSALCSPHFSPYRMIVFAV